MLNTPESEVALGEEYRKQECLVGRGSQGGRLTVSLCLINFVILVTFLYLSFAIDHYKWSHWLRLQNLLHPHTTNLSQSRQSLSSHWFRNSNVIQSFPTKFNEKSARGLLKKVSSILKRDTRKIQPLFFLWVLLFWIEPLKLIWVWVAFRLPPTWRWNLHIDGWNLGPWWHGGAAESDKQ